MSSEEMSGAQVRRLLAGALAGVARGLSATARMVEQTSWILRPREPAAGERTGPEEAVESEPVHFEEAGDTGPEPAVIVGTAGAGPADAGSADAVAEEPGIVGEPDAADAEPAAEPGPAAEPPTVGAPEGPDRVRVAETHIAELAGRSVADVTAEIPGLSTDELEQLYAYEVTHKNRKTVLRAIERAVAPASDSR